MVLHPGERSDRLKALDASLRAAWARTWVSISPESQWLAWTDWARHLAISPGKSVELADLALRQWAQSIHGTCTVFDPSFGNEATGAAANDRRFKDPGWDQYPFSAFRCAFLGQQQWWHAATHGVDGVEPHHERLVSFWAKQWLDIFSPGNFIATNPVVLERTLQEGGANLSRGFGYFLEDARAWLTQTPPAGAEQFEVGRNVAITPGKVVLRNRLMELIQYAPSTEKVHAEPILIVPAWIMKYYILDLSQHNSLIKYLVDQGHTVFCISWKNPDADDRDMGMDDYIDLGWRAALDAVSTIVPNRKIHATGYCLGGTLLAIAAAAMARDGDDRLASLSLFAAQTDFSEPGELGLFIDEAQITLLEAQMAERGYLRAGQMAGAFQMLRSYDLLWSRLTNKYLLGDRQPMNDLMAWNADATRMPAKMHSQYLRRLFLNDDLSKNRYPVDGRPVSLTNIVLPIFCVGTTTDHVAPWRSVYKLHHLSPAEITFVLTSGGHNAGIVNEPGRPRRHYQILTRAEGEAHLTEDEWLAAAPMHQGSWWTSWAEWLKAHSGSLVSPPRMGASRHGYKVLCDAPGTYVMVK